MIVATIKILLKGYKSKMESMWLTTHFCTTRSRAVTVSKPCARIENGKDDIALVLPVTDTKLAKKLSSKERLHVQKSIMLRLIRLSEVSFQRIWANIRKVATLWKVPFSVWKSSLTVQELKLVLLWCPKWLSPTILPRTWRWTRTTTCAGKWLIVTKCRKMCKSIFYWLLPLH